MATPLKAAGGPNPEMPGVVETVTLVTHEGCYIVVNSYQIHAESLDHALEWFDQCIESFMSELDPAKLSD